jgi:hypothetical protein
MNPGVRCCFMSGDLGRYTEQELLRRRTLAIVPKPFRIADLVPFLQKHVT